MVLVRHGALVLTYSDAEANRIALSILIAGLGIAWLPMSMEATRRFRGGAFILFALLTFAGAQVFRAFQASAAEAQKVRADQIAAAAGNLVQAHADNFVGALRPGAFVIRSNPRMRPETWTSYVQGLNLGCIIPVSAPSAWSIPSTRQTGNRFLRSASSGASAWAVGCRLPTRRRTRRLRAASA
jgi:hypothetical protein